jgi:YjbE family integral membrane protein
MTVPRSGPRQFRGEAPPQVGASRTKGFVVDFLAQDFMHAPFWIAVLQIIGVNIILSGDNAVVIAMACMTLPAKQRLWGMILGAGVAVLLRVIFTLVVAQAMTFPFLKLVGGLLLFYVAIKLVTEDSDGEGGVESASNLWRAVRIVAIADIVMSLDNVIAIAASAEVAAAQVDVTHAMGIKATLIIFGLATSVPLIVAGSAVLMALLERYRVLVWAGGALLGWVAGDIMATDPALVGWLSEATLHFLHVWGGRVGAVIVILAGYIIVSRGRKLHLDEILAGVGLLVWIIGDIVNQSLFGVGAEADVVKIWASRGVLLVIMLIGYAIARSQCAVSGSEEKA